MAKNDKLITNPIMREKFIEMFCMGMKMTDIAKELNVDRSTVYIWKDREDIKAEIDKYREEIIDTGKRFLKSRYLQYLNNIDVLCNQTDDKRTALSANQFMIEKLDGKNTTKIETVDNTGVDDDKNINLEDEFSKWKQLKEAK